MAAPILKSPQKPVGGGQTIDKKTFVEQAGKPKTLLAPKSNRVKRGSDTSATGLKVLMFGASGTGKTFTIAPLLERGYNVVCMTTDLGGDGTLSVKLDIRRRYSTERANELLDKLHIVVLNNDKEVQEFLKEPAIYIPYIYDLSDVVLFWDGFSSWQVNDLFESVGANAQEEAGSKLISSARSEGNKFEMQDWGVVRNTTLKTIDKAFALNNKVTGEIWSKIITCVEEVKSRGGALSETKSPFVSGAAGKLLAGGFDLILRTTVKTETEGDEGKRVYKYIVEGNQSNMAKNRGFVFDGAVIDADFGKLWDEMLRQAGVARGMVNENVKGEVLIAKEAE